MSAKYESDIVLGSGFTLKDIKSIVLPSSNFYFQGKGVVPGIGVGQRRAALAKWCGETFFEGLISESRFEE